MTLTDFLLARIAEDEEDAGWVGVEEIRGASERFSSERLRSECEAKLRIVERAANWHGGADPFEDGYDTAMEEACRFLALSYADHPDYREEWKP